MGKPVIFSGLFFSLMFKIFYKKKYLIFQIVIFFLFVPWVFCSENGSMALIPEGSFIMGGDFEKDQMPSHEVYLDSFYIDIHEVVQQDFREIMGFNPSKHKGPNFPVESVDWFEADQYCQKIGKRLPTEAEWEKSVRGDTLTRFYWGNEMKDDFSWFKGNSNGQSHPVGLKNPNGFGLYDMSGNVWEWVSDWYDMDYYKRSPTSNPEGPERGDFKVQRGGAWSNQPDYHASSYRMVYGPLGKDEFNGFRCAKSK